MLEIPSLISEGTKDPSLVSEEHILSLMSEETSVIVAMTYEVAKQIALLCRNKNKDGAPRKVI